MDPESGPACRRQGQPDKGGHFALDASIMPEDVTGNPNAAIIIVAEKISDGIRR
jgi:hypothetical protein